MATAHYPPHDVEYAVWQGGSAVVGTLDSGLRIERISGEARILFKRAVDELIGESLLALVTEDDVTTCLTAFAVAAASQRGVRLNVSVHPPTAGWGSEPLLCEVLISPLSPSPSWAFVLSPLPAPALDLPDAEAMARILNRSDRGAKDAPLTGGVTRVFPNRDILDVSRLTTRELQIVSRLLDGYRPPGIARTLFLSQSTVRNHLSSVFRKLGVESQEALLELFRASPTAEGAQQAHSVDHDTLARIF
ncbi:MAG: helix-turn-helix transcriptional regulator [Ornithinibacter sp.]